MLNYFLNLQKIKLKKHSEEELKICNDLKTSSLGAQKCRLRAFRTFETTLTIPLTLALKLTLTLILTLALTSLTLTLTLTNPTQKSH